MNRWSTDDIQFLIDNYPIKDISFCCESLNRSERQIRLKAFKLRIKRQKDISGENNPNWKGGKIKKICVICGKEYFARNCSESNFCSLKCCGISQRGIAKRTNLKYTKNICFICNNEYEVKVCLSQKSKTCSLECSRKYRSIISSGENNPNWNGGLSRMPYPYNWESISKSIIKRDGAVCMNPCCEAVNKRITVHHIDYDKMNCDPSNLITVCETCNSVANFGRQQWYEYYMDIQNKRGVTLIEDSIPKAKQLNDREFMRGEQHPMSKLTNQDVYEIRSYLSILNSRGTKSSLARLFNVTPATIRNIEIGKVWR